MHTETPIPSPACPDAERLLRAGQAARAEGDRIAAARCFAAACRAGSAAALPVLLGELAALGLCAAGADRHG